MCQRCRFFLDASCVAHFCNFLEYLPWLLKGMTANLYSIFYCSSPAPLEINKQVWIISSSSFFGDFAKYTINIWPQDAVLPWLISVHLEGLAWELFIWTVFGREGS